MDFRQSLIIQHLRERGPQLTEKDVHAFEQEIGTVLPSDYRDFLLEFNGGCNYERCFIEFPTPDGPVGDSIGLISLFGINLSDDEHSADIRHRLKLYKNRIPQGTIPVGTDSGDFLLVDAKAGGIVYFWSHEIESSNENPNDNKFFLARSFSEFLLGCRYISDEEMEMHSSETEEPFRSITLRRNEQLQNYLDNGCPLFETNEQDQTLLYVACSCLNYEAAEELLRRGADPDDGDHGRGYPPIYAAAAPGASELVALLLSYGASPYMDAEKTRHVLDSLPTSPTEHMRNVFQTSRVRD